MIIFGYSMMSNSLFFDFGLIIFRRSKLFNMKIFGSNGDIFGLIFSNLKSMMFLG